MFERRTSKDEKHSVDHIEEGSSKAAKEGHARVSRLQTSDVGNVLHSMLRVIRNQPANGAGQGFVKTH